MREGSRNNDKLQILVDSVIAIGSGEELSLVSGSMKVLEITFTPTIKKVCLRLYKN